MTDPVQSDPLNQSSSDESQVNVSVTVPILVQSTISNQVSVENITVPIPGASIEAQPARLARLLTATGKTLLWVIQNPEWALKWALTILAIKLFLSEGFTLEALQKLQKPEVKLPVQQLPTNRPNLAPSPP